MKKTLAVILALLMTFFAAGCYRNVTADGVGATRSRALGGFYRDGAYDTIYDGDRGILFDETNNGTFGGGATRTFDGARRDGNAVLREGARYRTPTIPMNGAGGAR